MTSLCDVAFKFLTTQDVSESKLRRRREQRRRRKQAKVQRARYFEKVAHGISSKKSSKQDDDTCMTWEEDYDVSTPSIPYRKVRVAIGNESRPFVGRIQAKTALVHVPEEREWYEIY